MAFPLILQNSELAAWLDQQTTQNSLPSENGVCLVDLRSAEFFDAAHIPGAVNADAKLLNRSETPVGGLLPEPQVVRQFLQIIGARTGDQIVAYDAGHETAAARMIWVLDAYGYEATSWLNGGFKAWSQAGYPVSKQKAVPATGNLSPSLIGSNVISVDALMDGLQKSDIHILDVRTLGEFNGTDVRSAFGGHVPGASHLEWTRLLNEDGTLLDDKKLQDLFDNGTGPKDEPVIVYCQTHQRSAVTYIALKHLGYNDVRAIDGAWSNWGNRKDTPKETLS